MSSPEAGPQTTEPDDLNVGLIATIAIVGALLVGAIAAALTALVRSESTAYGNEVGAYADLGTVARLKADQRGKLTAPTAWVDRSKGQISIPIDRAMAAVTEEIGKNPYLATEVSAVPVEAAPAPPVSAAPDTAGKPENNGKTGIKDGKARVVVDPPHGAPVRPVGAPGSQK